MKIKETELYVDASYNTIRKFILENEGYYYKDSSDILRVTELGLSCLQEKYGHVSSVISEDNENFYLAQISILKQQLEIANKYSEVFNQQLSISSSEVEVSRLKIKELERALNESNIQNIKLEHRLETEKNKSLWKKIFGGKGTNESV